MIRTWDGKPAAGGRVSLLPAELKAGERDRYFQTVPADREGHFAFDGVRPGRYLVGRLATSTMTDRNRTTRIPAVYYPGTPDRDAAMVIVMHRSGQQDVDEFRIPIGE